MGVNKHLTHVEELVLTKGNSGAQEALQVLDSVGKTLSPSGGAQVTITTKWDGAPAVVCVIDPADNKDIKVMGSKPHTLKFTQNSSVCVRHISSFKIAKPKKNHIHLKFKIFHPSSFKGNDFPKINFKRGSLVKYFPKKSDKPNKILIIVGFI